MSETTIDNGNGFNSPAEEDFNNTSLEGSMQQILSDNLGSYVVIESLIGTALVEERAGTLYSVGISYLVLYEETSRTYIVCDIFSIKFVTFYLPGERPRAAESSNTMREQAIATYRSALDSSIRKPPAGNGRNAPRLSRAAYDRVKQGS
ncbi:MAG: hypothetical protein PHI27_06870 [Eubacteriales bacterium]|nr:hypothetical protein [Eubacteriales bacterium]MDD3881957.1 hypothetical protein [Eubacteriales bacterium]MDD4513142.1 hypothetical protein [Eubacteriales bacterium]